MSIKPPHIKADDFVETFKQGIMDGKKYCFIIGAGASLSSGVSTGQTLAFNWFRWFDEHNKLELAREYADQLYYNSLIYHKYDEIESAYMAAKQTDPKNGLLPSEFYFDAFKIRFFKDKSVGYTELEKSIENAKPGFAYSSLAQLLTKYGNCCNLVITTNFDSLLEDALFIYTDKKPLVVNHEALAGYADNINIKRPIIAKIHRGLFFDPLNDPKETRALRGHWKRVLSHLFKQYAPIVIGYGGGDRSLMGLLKNNDLDFKKGLYWCSYKENAMNDPTICELLRSKNGLFVETNGFDSIMLKIGNALYIDSIIPSTVVNYLLRQADKRIDQYEKTYRELLLLDNSDVKTIQLSEQDAEEKRKNTGKINAWDYLRQGIKLDNAGHTESAISCFNEALRLNDNFATCYYYRGIAYRHIGEYQLAFDDFNKSIEIDPDFKPAFQSRAATFLKIDNKPFNLL